MKTVWGWILPDHISTMVPNEEIGDMIRGQQTAAIMNATPSMLAVTTLNVALTTAVLWGRPDPVPLVIWAVVAMIIVVLGLVGHRQNFGKVVEARPTKSRQKTIRNAFILGLVWAAVPVLFFNDATTAERVFITCIAAGMMGGGALALSRLPAAAHAMVLTVGVGGFFTLLTNPGMIYLGCAIIICNYAFALRHSTNQLGRNFIKVCLGEHQVRESAETIGLLLREFEDNSGDWIWETDANGNFRNVSERFLDVSGRSAEDLEKLTLADLLVSLPAAERRRTQAIGPENLVDLLEGRGQFREIMVCVSTPTGRKWWVFSGHAIYDPSGEFSGYKGVCSDISDRKEAELKLAEAAKRDQLTGLLNRTEFTTQMSAKLEEVAKTGSYLGVLYLDLDKFKNINDTLGHGVGDKVLIETAKRLSQITEKLGVVSRFGGDEFAIFCSAPNGFEDIERLCERLIAALNLPFSIDGHQIMIGTSIGVAISDNSARDPDRLIHSADLALYRAKSEGRGCFKLYAEHMDTALRERRALEGELRSAVANNELELHYQPLAEIDDGRVIGFEALVRWNNPRRGVISPVQFIPLAEETGMIHGIGEWVLNQACKDAKNWPSNMKVSVNLSGKQLTNYSIVQKIVDALAKSNLPPQRLELEITESVLIEEPEVTMELLKALRELGVSLALDDFGTGYSSLSYLVRFPFDKLKIDRSFVQGAAESPESLAIVRSILSLADDLNITTLAEGIETREHIELLRSEGCQQVQGFLLDKPMPQASIHQFTRYPIAGEEVSSQETDVKVIQIQDRLKQLGRA